MRQNIIVIDGCQKGNTALAVFPFCIAAADENCKFGDVGMRGARARGALRRRRKPCQGAAGNQTLRASTVTRSRRFLIQRRTIRCSVAALLTSLPRGSGKLNASRVESGPRCDKGAPYKSGRGGRAGSIKMYPFKDLGFSEVFSILQGGSKSV